MPGITAGIFQGTPSGFLMHGSRSGILGNSVENEFNGTARYARGEPNGLGWNYTIGRRKLARHMPDTNWGWHARKQSSRLIGGEFAQATQFQDIDEDMIFAWCYMVAEVRRTHPKIPLYFPTHAEVDSLGLTGTYDGKSDVYPYRDPRADVLRSAIFSCLDLNFGIRN